MKMILFHFPNKLSLCLYVCYLHMWVSMHACLYRSQKTTSGTFLYHDPHFVCFSRQCLTMKPWLSQNSVHRPVRPWTLRNLPGSVSRMLGIKDMCHDDLFLKQGLSINPELLNLAKQSRLIISNYPHLCLNVRTSTGVTAASCYFQLLHKCWDLHAFKVGLKKRHQPQGGKMMYYLH